MMPINPRELPRDVPSPEETQPQSASQDIYNIPINYIMQVLAAYKSNNCLKDLVPALSFPTTTTVTQVPQLQISPESLPALTLPIASGSVPVLPHVAQSLMYIQDQPVFVYNIPVSNNANVQRLFVSIASPELSQGASELPRTLPQQYIPIEVDSRQACPSPLPNKQKRPPVFGTLVPYRSTRLKWSAEMSRDLENVYDSLLAARVRPTQRVVHEIMKEKYPFMTELHVQSKLQKLRQIKKTIIFSAEDSR